MSKAQFLILLGFNKQAAGRPNSTNINAVFPRFQSQSDLSRMARERKQKYFSRRMEDHHRLLVPSQDKNHWSTSTGKYGKDWMPALMTGREASRWDTDTYRMRKHIDHSSL